VEFNMEKRVRQTVWTLTIMLVLGLTGVLYSNNANAVVNTCSSKTAKFNDCELIAVAGPKGEYVFQFGVTGEF